MAIHTETGIEKDTLNSQEALDWKARLSKPADANKFVLQRDSG